MLPRLFALFVRLPFFLFCAFLLFAAEMLIHVSVWMMNGDLVEGAFLIRFDNDWILGGDFRARIKAATFPTFEAAHTALAFRINEQNKRAHDRYRHCSQCGAVLSPGNPARKNHPGVCCECAHPGGSDA